MSNISSEGSDRVVLSHPYKIPDRLILSYILSQRRTDFRILANHVFQKAKDLEKVILPINFDETREAPYENI